MATLMEGCLVTCDSPNVLCKKATSSFTHTFVMSETRWSSTVALRLDLRSNENNKSMARDRCLWEYATRAPSHRVDTSAVGHSACAAD